MGRGGCNFALVVGDHTPVDADTFFKPDHFYQEKIDGRRAICQFDARGKPCFHGLTGPPWTQFSSSATFRLSMLDGEFCGDRFQAFDLLMLNGQDLRQEPLLWRLSALACLMLPPWVHRVAAAFGAEAGRRLLAEVLARGGEGVVRKNPHCTYLLSDWVRLKGNLTLDLILLSVDEAKGLAEVGEFHRHEGQSSAGLLKLNPGQAHVAAGCVGGMVEVAYQERARNGKLRNLRFIRFRSDKESPAVGGQKVAGQGGQRTWPAAGP
jgi:hypothetical protein